MTLCPLDLATQTSRKGRKTHITEREMMQAEKGTIIAGQEF